MSCLAVAQRIAVRAASGTVVQTDRANPGPCQVELDVTRGLKIGGREQLRREAYFNIHGTSSELDSDELGWLAGELNAHFGRSMGGISSFMHGLTEDKSRPGFADPELLAKRVRQYWKNRREHYAKQTLPVEIVNSVHPYSYYGRAESEGQGDRAARKKTFAPGSHEAAAEILSAFYQAAPIELEPYFEVANECNVKARGLGTTFADMCDLHSALARRLHRDVPGLKVGGPTSAWPAFEVKDFKIWREQMGMFIDRAGKDMDFLSLHLYSTHWDDKYLNRFGSNIDAILDLIESQSLLSTGEVKPLLISECGSGFRSGEQIMEKYSPKRDWFIMRGANHILMNLVRRDDRLAKMIPFMVLKATWYQEQEPYPWVLFHKEDGQWAPTHLAKWYEFWKDVAGCHLPTKSSSLDLQTHAFLDGKTVFLVLDNLASSEISLDVAELLHTDVEVAEVSISRLFLDGELPELSTNQPLGDSWRNVVLTGDETCILRIELSSPPQLEVKLTETTHYADRTLQPITTKPVFFQVENPVDLAAVADATLRVGFGRQTSLSKQPIVSINGKQLSVPLDERGECNLHGAENFLTKEINVPPKLLKRSNRVSVQFPDSGGHVSSVVLVTRHEVAP